jgi:hypothetical protein
MRCKTIAKIVVGVLVVGVGLGYVAFKDDIAALWDKLHVKIAEYPQPKKTVWLDQGISKEKLIRERGPSASPMNGSWRWNSQRFRG